MAKAKGTKKPYTISNEVLVDFKLSARINLSDLGIYPEAMSETEIKSRLIKALHEIIFETDDMNISSYSVDIHKNTATIRSRSYLEDEEVK